MIEKITTIKKLKSQTKNIFNNLHSDTNINISKAIEYNNTLKIIYKEMNKIKENMLSFSERSQLNIFNNIHLIRRIINLIAIVISFVIIIMSVVLAFIISSYMFFNIFYILILYFLIQGILKYYNNVALQGNEIKNNINIFNKEYNDLSTELTNIYELLNEKIYNKYMSNINTFKSISIYNCLNIITDYIYNSNSINLSMYDDNLKEIIINMLQLELKCEESDFDLLIAKFKQNNSLNKKTMDKKLIKHKNIDKK